MSLGQPRLHPISEKTEAKIENKTNITTKPIYQIFLLRECELSSPFYLEDNALILVRNMVSSDSFLCNNKCFAYHLWPGQETKILKVMLVKYCLKPHLCIVPFILLFNLMYLNCKLVLLIFLNILGPVPLLKGTSSDLWTQQLSLLREYNCYMEDFCLF